MTERISYKQIVLERYPDAVCAKTQQGEYFVWLEMFDPQKMWWAWSANGCWRKAWRWMQEGAHG